MAISLLITFRALLRSSIVAVLVAIGTWSSVVQAQPVTLRFEAEITTVFPGNPIDPRLALNPGDVFEGQFTFEPNPGDDTSPFTAIQPFSLSLHINGLDVSLPTYELASHDDTPVDVDCADTACPAVFDELILGGSGLLVEGGSVSPTLNSASSSLRMLLSANADPNVGGQGVLDSANIPSNVDVWNGFLHSRQLEVQFVDDQTGNSGFRASVGVFAVVPEPSGLCIAVFVTVLVVANSRFVFQSRIRVPR